MKRIILFVLASLPLAAAPPKNSQVEAQLRKLFDRWDLNHDGFLDKDELAKHFRGSSAKPPEGNMYDDKGNLTSLFYQAKKKYPDLIFLWSLDKDMDGQISWPEFEKYGQAYAAALRQRLQSQQRLLANIQAQAYRNIRNSQYRRNYYVRNGRRYYGQQQRHTSSQYARNVVNYQRQMQRVRAQAMRQYRSALARQRNFYRMAAQQRRQWLQRVQSYTRRRVAYAHRMVLRHFHAARGRGRRR